MTVLFLKSTELAVLFSIDLQPFRNQVEKHLMQTYEND